MKFEVGKSGKPAFFSTFLGTDKANPTSHQADSTPHLHTYLPIPHSLHQSRNDQPFTFTAIIPLQLNIMATVAHCLFCFESLAANLEDREPMSLAEIQASWAEYPKGLETEASNTYEDDSDVPVSKNLKQSPALQRLAQTSASSLSSPSTPSSASSTSLTPTASDVSTPISSLNSSNSSFTPPGIAPRSSQKSSRNITESPLFVTWNKKSTRLQQYNLRGCIGNFSDLPLASAIAEYALVSAFQDNRFPPISLYELPRLSVDVTLLTDFEDAKDAMDWELGVHGLRISFYWHNRKYGSTYLPDVAVEQGWNKEETVISLMRKAGWRGREDKWKEVELKVTRYQGMRETVDYEEFRAWREWVDGK